MKQIGFIAGQDGAVVKYDPKLHAAAAPKAPSLPLTRHQRATLYFKALRYIEALFRDVGFHPITLDSHTAFTIELGDFILEMSAQIPPPMAHITSYPGYRYDSEQINAKVTSLSPGQPGEYVIRVIATLPNLRTLAPVYVVIDKDSADPLRDAFMSALASAKSLIQRDPATLAKIQAVMAKRDLAKDFDRFRAQDPERQLPG
jgi:hypothetical protein